MYLLMIGENAKEYRGGKVGRNAPGLFLYIFKEDSVGLLIFFPIPRFCTTLRESAIEISVTTLYT